jgi:hypothetical protein
MRANARYIGVPVRYIGTAYPLGFRRARPSRMRSLHCFGFKTFLQFYVQVFVFSGLLFVDVFLLIGFIILKHFKISKFIWIFSDFHNCLDFNLARFFKFQICTYLIDLFKK